MDEFFDHVNDISNQIAETYNENKCKKYMPEKSYSIEDNAIV
jgi:hypothetical protein